MRYSICTAFPHLFRLTRSHDARVVDVWVQDTEAWDLQLCQNLNDLESIEWAALSLLLPSVHLRLCLILGFGPLILPPHLLLNLLWMIWWDLLTFMLRNFILLFKWIIFQRQSKFSFGNSA